MMRFSIVPDIVFLQLGENDMSVNTDSRKLAVNILAIAQYLHDGVGVKLVIIRLIQAANPPHAVCFLQEFQRYGLGDK